MHAKPFITALLTALFLFLGTSLSKADSQELEYKVKAAFLLNFAKFTAWPLPAENTPGPFTLCVLGTDPFGQSLDGLAEKQINGNNIEIRRTASSAAIGQCRLVFVSKSEQADLQKVLRLTAGHPIVTVSDMEGFAAAGGTIEFKNKEGRLSFIINNTKARMNGLRFSSSLLTLALEVL